MPRTAATQRQLVRNFGTCLNFNGTTAFVNTTYAPATISSTSQLSISLWAKIPKGDTTNSATLFGSKAAGVNELIIFYNDGASNGRPTFYYDYNGDVSGNGIYINNVVGDIRDGLWHHWCLVKNANYAELYIDGVSRGSDTSNAGAQGTGIFTSRPFYIGCRNGQGTADRFSKAEIDEVAWIDTNLTVEQVQSIYYTGSYPTTTKSIWYKFDEGSGTSATDSSGNGNTGTITNATYSTDVFMIPRTTAGQRRVAKNYVTSLSFAGGANTVLIDSANIVSGQTDFTISIFMKRNGNAGSNGYAMYCERATSGNDILKLEIKANTKLPRLTYRDDAGTLNQIDGTIPIADGPWHNIVVTKTGTAIAFYVDGVAAGTGTLTATDNFTNANQRCRIGSDQQDGTAAYIGLLDELTLFTRALSPSEVQTLFYGYTPASTQFVGWYKLDEGSGTSATDSSGTRAAGVITGATYSSNVFGVGRTAA